MTDDATTRRRAPQQRARARPDDRAWQGRPLHEIAREAASDLERAGVPTPAVDARWLIEGVVGRDPRRHPDERLPAGAVAALRAVIDRRARREPLQLVLGTAAFRTLQLRCGPGVFVPRPETEIVAGLAIEAVRSLAGRPALVVEPCTGTGAIACAIAVEAPRVRVVAVDDDPSAVALARDNAARTRRGRAGPAGLATGATLEILEGDLLSPLDPQLRGHVDVLVANPPYLPLADRRSWEPEVADHDPQHALVGGPDGHEVVDELLHQAASWLAVGGVAVLEIDERRGADAVASAVRAGLVGAEVRTDLAGAERVLLARRRR